MKIGSTFLLILCHFLSFSQFQIPAKVEWGETLQKRNGESLSDIIGSNSKGFYILRYKPLTFNYEHYLDKYDHKLKRVKSIKIDMKRKKSYTKNFNSIVWINGKLHLIWAAHSKKKKAKLLFMQNLDMTTLIPNEKVQKLTEVTNVQNWTNDSEFDIDVSRDSSKILVYAEIPGNTSKSPQQFKIHVFDSRFNALWSKEITLPYKDKLFSTKQILVDNNGNVFISGILYKDKWREKVRGKPNYEYVILRHTPSEKSKYSISLEDEFISELKFDVLKNGDLLCSGFYSKMNSSNLIGTYFFKIDTKQNTYYNVNKKAFDFDVLSEFIGERKAERLKKGSRTPELFSYDIKKLVPRSDGGVIMIAEQFYITKSTFDDRLTRRQNTTYYYNYMSILVANIDANGNIAWVSRIPKRQVTSNDGGFYSSFATSIVRDKIFFIFNDNEKNLVNTDRDKIYSTKLRNSIITLVELDRFGKIKRYKLGSSKEDGIYLRPKVCEQSGRKEMLIYGEKGNSYKFAKIRF